jgi:DnaJ like chaperone protein
MPEEIAVMGSCFVFKLLFSALGLKLASLLGTTPIAGIVVGLFFGSLIDIAATQKWRAWRYNSAMQKQAQAAFQNEFLGSLFFIFGRVCAADGAITQDEIKEVEYIIKDVLKLNKKDRKAAIQHFKSARNSSASFQSHVVAYFELYKDHPEMLNNTIQMLMRIAMADGQMNEKEEEMINRAANIFGIPRDSYVRLRSSQTGTSQNITSLDQCYEVLGCAPADSDSEIKQSYRSLVSKYHPDKIVSKDLPEEFIQLATKKMQDIQSAYETLKSQRGFN